MLGKGRLLTFILLIIIFTTVLTIRLRFYFLLESIGTCDTVRYDFSKLNINRENKNDIPNKETTDETFWYYKNSIDGSWRRWDTSIDNKTNKDVWKVKWLNRQPENSLGVIVYLTSTSDLSNLSISLTLLRQYLFKSRPVVIFHEGDFNNDRTQLTLANILGSDIPIGFEHIRFPRKVNVKSTLDTHSTGYYHMCKFFGMMLSYHPLILTKFTYYIRLDSHSYLLGPRLNYDLFEHMEMNRLQYGFIMVNADDRRFVQGLWDFFQKFLVDSCIKPSAAVKKTQISALTGWYSKAIFFNNFEISNGSLWRTDPRIRAWLHQVDKSEGIYRYRWGDAPIRTLAVTQFLDYNQVVQFRDIGYFHRREYTCSIRVKQCVIPSYLHSKVNMIYHQGCYSNPNPLCQYYSQKI